MYFIPVHVYTPITSSHMVNLPSPTSNIFSNLYGKFPLLFNGFSHLYGKFPLPWYGLFLWEILSTVTWLSDVLSRFSIYIDYAPLSCLSLLGSIRDRRGFSIWTRWSYTIWLYLCGSDHDCSLGTQKSTVGYNCMPKYKLQQCVGSIWRTTLAVKTCILVNKFVFTNNFLRLIMFIQF